MAIPAESSQPLAPVVPLPDAFHDWCKHCGDPIYLPDDRVSLATFDGGRHCLPSPYGWHDAEE
jgi:hypothetical protein